MSIGSAWANGAWAEGAWAEGAWADQPVHLSITPATESDVAQSIGYDTGITDLSKNIAKLASSSNQYYTFPDLSYAGEFSVKFKFATIVTSPQVMLGNSISGDTYIATNNANTLLLNIVGSGQSYAVTGLVNGRAHECLLYRDAANLITAEIDGGVAGSWTAAGTVIFDMIAAYLTATSTGFTGHVFDYAFWDNGTQTGLPHHKYNIDGDGTTGVLVDSGTSPANGTEENITDTDVQSYLLNTILDPARYESTTTADFIELAYAPDIPGGVDLPIITASESDVASIINYTVLAGAVNLPIGAASESDTAQSIGFSLYESISPATETDIAQQLGYDTYLSIAPAFESDVASVVNYTMSGGSVYLPVIAATETDEAQTLSYDTYLSIVPAMESDVAQVINMATQNSVSLPRVLSVTGVNVVLTVN